MFRRMSDPLRPTLQRVERAICGTPQIRDACCLAAYETKLPKCVDIMPAAVEASVPVV